MKGWVVLLLPLPQECQPGKLHINPMLHTHTNKHTNTPTHPHTLLAMCSLLLIKLCSNAAFCC